MDEEIKKEELEAQENADVSEPVETAEPQVAEEKPKGIKGLIKYIKTHENVRQLVLFTLFSMICGLTQFTITLVLPIILKSAAPDTMNKAFAWPKIGEMYFFDFRETGLGSFLGWLIGSIWGQTLTFILNRKKTFNAPDHLAFRATAYTVMAVLIILVQTALGKLEGVFNANDPDASKLVQVIYNLLAQVIAGMAAFIMSFLGNKFIIMRKFKTKDALPEKDPAEEIVEEPSTEE